MSELSLWILAAVASAIFGPLVACLFMRSRTIAVHVQLTATESQLNEKNKRLETLEPEYQKSMEAKARAEQEAKRVPDLEKELKQATTDNTNLASKVAELKKAQEADKEKIQWAENAKQHLREAFLALASEALQSNARSFLTNACQELNRVLADVRGDWTTQKLQMDGLVEPLKQNLTNLDGQIRLLEQKREGAYQSLEEQLRQLGLSHQQLQMTTVKLEQALKSPSVRGSWGQMQLRRVVEMAGMVPHVSFSEQVTIEAGRPDMIVYLPNQAVLPVDAKAPMQSFFEAMESADGEVRKTKLQAHAEAVRFRVRELSQKKYWEKFERAPEFVVMFVPNDTCLSAAFEHDPELLEFAFEQRVLLTTPVTLLALLKAVAYGWQQQQIAENARQIAEQGRELYDRLVTFLDHFKKTGNGLDSAVNAYNEAVGSLESRVFPAARRFKELGATTADLPDSEAVEGQLRQLNVVELAAQQRGTGLPETPNASV